MRLSPNRSRVLYDVSVGALASLAASGVCLGFVPEKMSYGVFLAPLFLLTFNALIGLYSRYKVGTGRLKTALLTGTVLASFISVYLLSQALFVALLWALLVWGPLVLPRVFLNLNPKTESALIRRTVRDRGPVLVVGGAGYIGTHVVEQLLKANFSVRILDRFLHGKDAIKDFVGNPRFEVVEGDATDIVSLVSAVDGASAVVHLAGLVGDPACAVDEKFTRHANVIATRMVREVAISMGVPRFVFASSCSVYGTNDNEVNESSELNPVSLYARTKIDSETELLHAPQDDFTVTVLRFATVFGHSRRPRFDLVANLFTAQAMNDGKITVTGESQWRPFIHVRDLARAVVAVLKASPEQVNGQIFNVGDKRLNMTIGELAKEVQAIVGKKKPVEVLVKNDVADRRNYAVSFEKIRKALGFEAGTLLKEGIEEIVSEFEKGGYHSYKEPKYSNLEMTRQALSDFRDPVQSAKLYRPVAEESVAVAEGTS